MPLPTGQDLFEAGIRELITLPTRFNPEIARAQGSDVNVVMEVSRVLAEEAVVYAQGEINGLLISTAVQQDSAKLDRLIFDRTGLTRNEDRVAIVTLRLRRVSLTTGVTVVAGSTFTTPDGIAFAIVNDVPFPIGSAGPFDVVATAKVAGRTGNVADGTITVIGTVQEDQSITVTNEEPAAGGLDRETNDEFAARAQRSFATQTFGTYDAILGGILNSAGVTQCTLIEITDPDGTPRARGEAIIADADGQANTAMADAVRESLRSYRALGAPVIVRAGVPQFQQITFSGLQFLAGTNTTTTLALLRSALVAAVNGLAPRVTLEQAALYGAAKSVAGLVVPAGSLIEPAGDVVPIGGAVIRARTDMVLLNGT